jgi:hypothetical protein
MPDESTLRERLKQSIEKSRAKKYHGNEENINTLPTLNEQALEYLKEGGDPFQFYDAEKKEFLDENDPKWFDALLQKFTWIKSIV